MMAVIWYQVRTFCYEWYDTLCRMVWHDKSFYRIYRITLLLTVLAPGTTTNHAASYEPVPGTYICITIRTAAVKRLSVSANFIPLYIFLRWTAARNCPISYCCTGGKWKEVWVLCTAGRALNLGYCCGVISYGMIKHFVYCTSTWTKLYSEIRLSPGAKRYRMRLAIKWCCGGNPIYQNAHDTATQRNLVGGSYDTTPLWYHTAGQ